MVGELMTSASIFGSLLTTVKGLKDINDAAVRNDVSIALQRQILEAQAEQLALVEKVRDLTEQISRFEKWETEKQRYQLEELPPGLFVYGVKADARGVEPDHKLCANCYNKSVKSILQRRAPHRGETDWECPSCGYKGISGYSEPLPQARRGSPESGWMA